MRDSLGTFLPDYVDKLYHEKKLATEIKGDDLEKLSTEFVKGLSTGLKDKLGIQDIINKIGVTVLDDDNHFRYVTTCVTNLKDGTKKTLVVNRPPNSSSIFRVPDHGPPAVLASKVPAASKEHGFKALNEPALITPVWKPQGNQNFIMTYKYPRGVPLVGHQPSGDFEAANFSWKLTQYCAYDPKKPNEIGEERFIFTGLSKVSENTHTLQGYYIRLEDLRRRVETDNASVAIKEDMKRFKANNPLYDLWLPNGALVDLTEAEKAFRPFEPTDGDVDDEVSYAKTSFDSNMTQWNRGSTVGIARLARLNSGLYDVLSRFWDGTWVPELFLQIDPKYQTQIRRFADAHFEGEEKEKELEGRMFDPEPVKGDRSLMALIEDLKGKRQFKPKITIIWNEGEIDQRKMKRWAAHPNSLYTLWIEFSGLLSAIQNHEPGVWLPERTWPSEEQLEDADGKIQAALKSLGTYKGRIEAEKTITEVTKMSMDIVRNYNRNPDQIGAMGKTSPNDWLHRSAWSYGGLYDGGNGEKVDPQSSQVMYNLIIGTHEANTMMIRDEIFVKRLV
ncbi:hypothetical protein FRC16_011262 [Serendipita sp. 398]|nr:hypothetical protein FRC16_011262 [Serendipita sp. 398]